MFLMVLTFVMTTAIYGILVGLAFRRVLRHLQNNPEGVRAVTDHVLIPLLGRQPDDERQPPVDEAGTP